MPAPNVATDLALRRFIRAIFSPFLYKFDPHIHPAFDVQANDFDCFNINSFEMRESYVIRDSHSTYKTMNYHYKSMSCHLATVDHDENGNVIYATDENGNPIRDSHGNPQLQYHYLTDEKQQNLQKGSDGKVHVSFNGIFTPPEEAAVYVVQYAKDKNAPLYFVVFPEANSAISELLVAGYQKLLEGRLFGD